MASSAGNPARRFRARLACPLLLERIVRRICRGAPRPVLDLGSGEGGLAARLRREGRKTIGVERGLRAEQLRADVERLPIATGSFDTAVLSLVLHYLPDPDRALAEAARVLRPWGRLLLADRIGAPEAARRARHREIEVLRNPAVGRFLTACEIEEQLRSAGFGVADEEDVEQRLPLEDWLRGVEDGDAQRIRRRLEAAGDLGGLVLDPDGQLRLRMRLVEAVRRA